MKIRGHIALVFLAAFGMVGSVALVMHTEQRVRAAPIVGPLNGVLYQSGAPNAGSGRPAPVGQLLVNTATGDLWVKTGVGATAWTLESVSGGGTFVSYTPGQPTVNVLPKYSSAGGAVANSSISDDGTNVTITDSTLIIASTLTPLVNGGLFLAPNGGSSVVHIGNGTDGLTWDGATTKIPSALAFTGVQTDSTTGTQNNVALNASTVVLQLTNASATTITGFTGGVDGRLLIVISSGAGTPTLSDDSASSSVGNRLYCESGSNTLLTGQNARMVLYVFNGNLNHWVEFARQSSQTSGAQTFSSTVGMSGAVDTTFTSTSHISNAGGTAPTLSSCGTSPTIAGGDLAGRVTTGTGATTCTISFARTYTGTVSCIVHTEGSATQPTYTVAAGAITMSVDIAATTYDYICIRSS